MPVAQTEELGAWDVQAGGLGELMHHQFPSADVTPVIPARKLGDPQGSIGSVKLALGRAPSCPSWPVRASLVRPATGRRRRLKSRPPWFRNIDSPSSLLVAQKASRRRSFPTFHTPSSARCRRVTPRAAAWSMISQAVLSSAPPNVAQPRLIFQSPIHRDQWPGCSRTGFTRRAFSRRCQIRRRRP